MILMVMINSALKNWGFDIYIEVLEYRINSVYHGQTQWGIRADVYTTPYIRKYRLHGPYCHTGPNSYKAPIATPAPIAQW